MTEFQDQGSLDQPAQDVDPSEPRPGPVNPVLDAPDGSEQEQVEPQAEPQVQQPAVDPPGTGVAEPS